MPTKLRNLPPDELITLGQASELYGLSISYLRTIAQSGRLEARKIGHNWLTTPKAVEQYIASRTPKGAYREDLEA